jgi:hypothetical protein
LQAPLPSTPLLSAMAAVTAPLLPSTPATSVPPAVATPAAAATTPAATTPAAATPADTSGIDLDRLGDLLTERLGQLNLPRPT